jgi:hypothetical protein
MTRLRLVELTLAALPWLVVFDAVMPSLLKSFVAPAAVASMVWISMPLHYQRKMGPIAAALFIATMIANVVFATDSSEFIQFAKFMIFPIAAIAVLSDRGQEKLRGVHKVVMGSCLAAMVVHLGVVAAGLGQTGTKYNIGEKLGFGRDIVHEMTLTFVVIAAAGLVSSKRLSLQITFFALGAIPALLTGVRSALLALLVVLFIFIVRLGLSKKALITVVALFAAAFVSGGVQIVQNRFEQTSKQESSISSVGSGRGAIWKTAFDPWWNAGPKEWLFGTGLRSIEKRELKELGVALVGHSDLIQVGIEFGLVLFVFWLLIWLALLRAPLENIVLVPLIVYALVNGSIEYVAPITLGLAFSASCRAVTAEDEVPEEVPRDLVAA